MQIDSIEIFHVALPLKEKPATPAGRIEAVETVLVKMQSGQTVGWGEAAPGNGPSAGPEWAAGAFACLRDWMAPAVLGASIDSGDELQERLARFRGNRFAKAALDTAWWDALARGQGKPLHQLLDGQKESVEIGASFDEMESIDDFLDGIKATFEEGYARVELKMRPGWDLEMLRVVRQVFPAETFHVDFEGALRLDHIELLYRLDDFNMVMVEQPLPADDLVGHAMVQEALRTPVCLDEGITTLEQAQMALELKSCKYVNIDPGRVGGLTPAVAIHDACRENEVPCRLGAPPRSAVGARLGLALATKANFSYPIDYFAAHRLLEHDLAESPQPTAEKSDGKLVLAPSSQPGIGVDPDEELLERYSLARASLRT